MTEDEKLLLNLKKRKRDALDKVMKEYTPYVSVIIYNIIGNVMTKEDVEEVTADVFVGLWKHADSLDREKGTVKAYLGAAARNCAKNKLRKVSVHQELKESMTTENPEPMAYLEQKEKQNQLIHLISTLGETDSELFMRYYYYDEKISKIAKITGMNASTIKTRLVRGRKRLKEMLDNEGRRL